MTDFDKELVKILDEKYGAKVKQSSAKSYTCFIMSSNMDSLSILASILVQNHIEFEFEYDKEDNDGSLELAVDYLKKLKIALRKFIFDKEEIPLYSDVKDINGTKIYAGNLVKSKNSKKEPFLVSFRDGTFVVEGDYVHYHLSKHAVFCKQLQVVEKEGSHATD